MMVREEVFKQEKAVLESLFTKEFVAELLDKDNLPEKCRIYAYALTSLVFSESSIYLLDELMRRNEKVCVCFSGFEEAQDNHKKRSCILQLLENIKSESLRRVFFEAAKGKF